MSRQLLRSTFVVGSMTALSRIFGLLRDITIARFFGPGLSVDVFIVAFRIPNFLRRLFAEGGFSQAFVPVLVEYKTQRDDASVQALVDQTAATLGLILLIVTLIGICISPILIAIFAPGFIDEPEKYSLASQLLRITFPYILFIALTAFAGSILNTYYQFAVPAFTPVLLNLSLILCTVLLAPNMETPIKALAIGVFIAGIVQLLFQLPFLLRIKKMPYPGLKRDIAGIKKVMSLMLPILFSVSIVQINLLIDTLIASFLATGSISWLYFSDRLVEFPLGVFGLALATVILPNLSEKHAQGSAERFSDTLDWGLRWVYLIALPAAVGLIVLAVPLLTTLFQYNAFSSHDVYMTSKSLMAYSVGLPAFVLIKVLSAGFFSRQDTKTPVKIALIAMLMNLIMNVLLVIPFAHAGLALATSLSASLQAFLLFIALRRKMIYRARQDWPEFLFKLLIAVCLMGVFIFFGIDDPEVWFDRYMLQRVVHLFFWLLTGAMIYLSVLFLSGINLKNMTVSP